MNYLRVHRLTTCALLLCAVTLLVTCTDVGQGPGNGTRTASVDVRLLKTSLTQSISGVALRAIVDDEVVYRDTTDVIGNSFNFGEFSLPVGEATIIVEAFDEQGVVVYSAQTTVIIESGQLNSVQLQLVPVTPLMRLAPFHRTQNTQEKFVSTLELYNIERFVSTQLKITYNPSFLAFDFSSHIADEAWGDAIQHVTMAQPGELDVRFTRQSVTDDLVPTGVVELLGIRFHAIAPGMADISIDVLSLLALNGTVPEFSNLVEEGQTVELIGEPDDVVEFEDSELLDIIRELLDKSGGDIFVSELQDIIEVDASNSGLSNLDGLEFMINIDKLDLTGNELTDLTPLVNNSGLDDGDTVIVKGNPLGEQAQQQIEELRNRGVVVIVSIDFTGRVTDDITSLPLPNVTIELSGSTDRSTTTNTAGEFEIADVEDGFYQVFLTRDGYESLSDTVTIAGESVERNYEMTAIVVSTIISGTVTDSDNSAVPIEGATVTLSGEASGQTTTDNQGFYQFSSVPPGQYTIAIDADGYQPASRTFVVEASIPEVQDFALDLLVFSVSGAVTDVITGRPISGADVALDGPVTDNTSTDDQGFYSLSGLPPGQYVIDFTASLYEPETVAVTITNQDVIEDAALTPIPQTTSISGAVRDDAQAPIAGATVELSGPTNAQTTTDAQGMYEFTGVAPGSYEMIASATGYTSDTLNVVAVAGVPLTNQDFVLSQLLYSISGTVTDSVTGDPLISASVSVSGPFNGNTTTDGSGQYTISDLPPGQYTIELSASGYVTKSRVRSITTSSLTEDFSLRPVVITTTLSGTVTDAPDGTTPIAGATVALSGAMSDQTTTNAQGFYEFTDLPEGEYDITVSADGFITDVLSITISGADPVIEDFMLLPEVFTVSGSVTEFGTQTPIADATVNLAGPVVRNMTTDAQGFYELTDVPSGDYTMTVSAPGYNQTVRQVTVSGAATTENFGLVPLTVSGTVVNTGGSPLVGAAVTLTGPAQYTTTTNQSGQYVMSHVTPGTYTLEVTLSGYRTQSINLTVGGASLVRDFELKTVTTVSGSVGIVGGGGLVGVQVELSGPENQMTTTNGQGVYVFNDVIEGNYTIDVSHTGYVPQSHNIVVAGSPVVVDFLLEAGTYVEGQVTELESSTPVHGATVMFNHNGEVYSTVSGADGSFELGVLPQQSYTITVEAPNYETNVFVDTLTSDSLFLHVELFAIVSTLYGSVKDAQTGEIIVGATVTAVGPRVRSDLTNSDGWYEFDDLFYGTYEVTASMPGYIDVKREVDLGPDGLEEHFVLSTELTGAEMRIVLTWNALPEDMDLHYWIFQNDDVVYYVNWFDKGDSTLTSFPYAWLDNDDSTGFGPETITIGQHVPDSAWILVENYGHREGGEPTLTTESGAHLDVYQGITLEQMEVPTQGSGDWWHAFTIDQNGNTRIVNELLDLGGQSSHVPEVRKSILSR